MDWTTFFEENSQSLFTLGGVFLGSLITFFINYMNLRQQSIERDKDRNRERRKAIVLARERWTERDVLRMIDLMEKTINTVSNVAVLESSKKLTNEQISLVNKEYFQTTDTLIRYLYSFDNEEIVLSFEKFRKAMNDYLDQLPSMSEDDLDKRANSKCWMAVKQSAGHCYRTLREMMISIHEY